ncbi:major capsid pentamer protein [Mycobacterium phage 39HC]|uniref:major capsid pentamer protein n=1 Tax=Mycobacterium phage 39HC TaxID=1463809 RepID=UPI0003F20B0E|nr:major capsid pentamer protein [Mycobacterium phage 39HC]AHJ88311.1 major capsid pentamer protein [Mycobacterium phage 39HC]AHJ88411.1 major capsid pentamer protein [Mycobacterium phage 40BC]
MTTPAAPVLNAWRFKAPPVTPLAQGLYAATDWQAQGRFFNGVEVEGPNYGGEDSFGIWEADWCDVPPIDQAERKEGHRPDLLPPFDRMTVWAYDECDLTLPSRNEVEERAAQVLRLEEQTAVEREFANRLLEDAGTPEAVASLKLAVGYLEGEAAKANTPVWFHVGAQWASQEFGLFIKTGTRWTSPLGHTWVVGGGYVDGLVNTIVATSQPFGWRDAPDVRTAVDERHNLYAAVAERSVCIAYEAVIAAAQIAP